MDWKRLDKARGSVGPVELDLIESYAQGKVTRRDFVKRGTVIGLSMPFMVAIIAACGDDDDGGSSDTQPAATSGGDTEPAATTGGDEGGGSGGTVVVAIQQGDATSGLDPVNMLDLGTYNVLSQSFEYLVGLGPDGNIAATALAESWSPNEVGDVWTFNLRPGAVWSDGTPVTSADVAATMDRLSAQGNAALGGVIGEGSTDSSDPAVAEISLLEANGNFPVLVSLFNAQSLITPVDYTDGTTLDVRPEGSGAWVLDDWDATTNVAKFSRNPNWWGGTPPLDGIEMTGFADISTAVTAMQSRDIDVIQQFPVIGGEGLLNDAEFVVLSPPSANHRQVWFNTQQGQFTDPLVRQALAWTLDRPQMVDTLWAGRAEIGNDHPVLSTLPFYDPNAVEQRVRNIDMAKQLLSDAGVEGISANCDTGDPQEIPQLAAIIQQNAAEAGFDIAVNTQSNSTFYGAAWCPGASESDATLPCDGSAEFGIVDYGHRPVPDVYFSSALATGGVWNSSNYTSDEFDTQLSNYRTSIDVDGQKAAVGEIQKILWNDVPAAYPYFYNYLSGHDNSVTGVESTALGHTILSAATKG